ncbi:MAG: acylphosphatase [Desulfuromonas sp.]|nr:MAG: acylphosphatase [Desulfuromonas sp.]
MSQVRATLRIRGMVQGVSYRYYTAQTAQALNLTGWVRNLPSGEVEAILEGPRSDIQKMIEWCHEGPPAARVDEVSIDWEDGRHEFSDFTIRR